MHKKLAQPTSRMLLVKPPMALAPFGKYMPFSFSFSSKGDTNTLRRYLGQKNHMIMAEIRYDIVGFPLILHERSIAQDKRYVHAISCPECAFNPFLEGQRLLSLFSKFLTAA
jgi:hypothetical protein